MEIKISKQEAFAVGGLIDVFKNYIKTVERSVNDITTTDDVNAVDVKTTLQEIEDYLNKNLGTDIKDFKVVKISVTILKSVKIVIEDEFIVDFFSLYGKMIQSITPAIIMLAKSLKDSQEEFIQFENKWIKSSSFEE